MKNKSLSTKGQSMSQARSISNLCNQACIDIDSKLNSFNNASKELTLNEKLYVETQGHPITDDLIPLLKLKSGLHAAQAFLMENIKAKDDLLKEIKNKRFVYDVKSPEYPDTEELEKNLNSDNYEVNETWGWSQLTTSEYNEYLEAEAYASHIGQFIHKGGKLDTLRKELPHIKTLEWMEVEIGKKTPLNVTVHHTINQLGDLHERLGSIHREFEQKVNYYKAKIKNLVTKENARRAREIADLQGEINKQLQEIANDYQTKTNAWLSDKKKASMEFEESRQKEIERIASLRIEVDPRFKTVINEYLSKMGNDE